MTRRDDLSKLALAPRLARQNGSPVKCISPASLNLWFFLFFFRRLIVFFVLGHPGYYPRFGFTPAGPRGIEAPFPILPKNEDAWMVLELAPGLVGKVKGKVIGADAMMRPEHWRE